MKKTLLVLLSIATMFILSGCDELRYTNNAPTEEERMREMIEEILDEREDYLSEEALVEMIETLIPTTLTEEEIITIVANHVPTDLTRDEIKDLIVDMMPEDRYQSTFDLGGFEEALTHMLEARGHSVVGIRNYQAFTMGTGSGVIYKSEGNTYYVVTNDHVIENFTELEIVYERYGILNTIEDSAITFLGTDPVTDLAVLRFTSNQHFPTVDFADSYDLRVGQFVFAVGNPLGFEYYGTATIGILSGTARFLESGSFNATVLQHDAALSPGNSGGALFDIDGNLIGINHMKIIDSVATNIGFAIPSNTVQRVVNDLEAFGEVIRPFLGVSSNVFVNLCGEPFGACVEVLPGGAAEAAGLQDGDTIIGYKHESDDDFIDIFNFNDLREAILNSRVGDSVIIQYVRDGETMESEPTTLNRHPDD